MKNNKYTLTNIDGDERVFSSGNAFLAEAVRFHADLQEEVISAPRNLEEAIDYINNYGGDTTLEIEGVGLEVTLTLTGDTYTDIEMALDEARKYILNERAYPEGSDSNDSGSYAYKVEGEERLTTLDKLSLEQILDITKHHDISPDQEQEFIDYYPEGHANGDPYYRLDLYSENEGDSIDVTVYDGDSWENNDPVVIQSLELPENASVQHPK